MRNFGIGLAGLVPTAMLARLLWHYRLVQLGHRKFWSRDLLWEIPTAAFSAIIGAGIAVWAISFFSITDVQKAFFLSNATVGVCAWLGPRGIEALLCRIVDRHAGGASKGKE